MNVSEQKAEKLAKKMMIELDQLELTLKKLN